MFAPTPTPMINTSHQDEATVSTTGRAWARAAMNVRKFVNIIALRLPMASPRNHDHLTAIARKHQAFEKEAARQRFCAAGTSSDQSSFSTCCP